MDCISLLTDFGLDDNFVGVMKAVISKLNPRAKVLDICHAVLPQDILGAAFLLAGSFSYFPRGTVHLVVVDPGVGSKRKPVIVKTRDYFFVAPDNGVLSLALEKENPLKIIEISNSKYFLKPVSSTFHGRDIFAPVAAHLSGGKGMNNFGKELNSYRKLDFPKVKVSAIALTGQVIYIDRFGNLVSNIEKKVFFNFVKKDKFKISVGNRTIDRLSGSYSQARPLKPLALFDSFNFLEIAVNSNSAEKILNAKKGTVIKAVRL
jgi:S-adenosylmethionine hydrolase